MATIAIEWLYSTRINIQGHHALGSQKSHFGVTKVVGYFAFAGRVRN